MSNQGRLNVLHIDDSGEEHRKVAESIYELSKATGRDYCYLPVHDSSWFKKMNEYRALSIHALLLDLNLSGNSMGYDVYREILECYPHIAQRVATYTTDTCDQANRLFASAGVDFTSFYVQKGNPAQLAHYLEQLSWNEI